MTDFLNKVVFSNNVSISGNLILSTANTSQLLFNNNGIVSGSGLYLTSIVPTTQIAGLTGTLQNNITQVETSKITSDNLLQSQINVLNSSSVKITGNQTISGIKTFTNLISGDVSYTPTISSNWITSQTSFSSALNDFAKNLSPNRILIKDDFIINSAISTTPAGPGGFASDSANGGTITTTSPSADHPGIISLNTGTSKNTTGRGSISLGINTIVPTGTIMYSTIISPNTLSVVTLEYTVVSGLSNTQTATPNNGIYFLYDRLTYGNVWVLGSASDGSRTLVPTAIPVVANTWYKLSFIAYLLNGSKRILYYINDQYIDTITTNIPSGNVGVRNQILKNASSGSKNVSRSLFVDYMSFTMDLPTR